MGGVRKDIENEDCLPVISGACLLWFVYRIRRANSQNLKGCYQTVIQNISSLTELKMSRLKTTSIHSAAKFLGGITIWCETSLNA